MQVAIYQLDSDLTIRIPKALANQAGLRHGMQVELRVIDNKLMIVPITKQYDLEELLSGITPDNLHSEVDTGKAVGNEAW